MDVNRDNFYDVLPQILKDINDADFVAVDGEFSGILGFDKMNHFDNFAERYKRHYECDRHYLMIQMGLAMVRCTNPAENRYTLKAYNFYLFPENESDAFDFRSKTSSLQFLAANRFDFAQLFLKGIPFVCKTTHLQKLRNQPGYFNRRSGRPTTNGNANDRRLETTTNSPKRSEIDNMSDTELLGKAMSGFSEVVWKLQESGKPLIGHNLHMDILHIVNQFFTPVPSSYDEYKSIVKSLFPKLIDTKTIASTSIFQNIISNTALNAVYKVVRESPFPPCHFDTPVDFKYDAGEHEHTAGYDATCTAICMTKMMAYIAGKTEFKENPMEHSLVAKFTGKIFYMRSFDLKYSDLLNDDELPDRSRVFYINHPTNCSTMNIREFFSQWGVIWCERYDHITHIIVMTMKNDNVDTMLVKMRANDKNFLVTPYAEFNKLDPSTIKVKVPDHLFDVEPPSRRSAKRTYVDRDATEPAQDGTPTAMEVTTDVTRKSSPRPPNSNSSPAEKNSGPTIEQLIEQKEKARGVKRPKLFDYEDEW